MITTTVNFNQTELLILNALYEQAQECTGGEFGYMPDVDRCGLTPKQFSGYISDLRQKEVFEYLDPTDKTSDYAGQYILKPEYNKAI